MLDQPTSISIQLSRNRPKLNIAMLLKLFLISPLLSFVLCSPLKDQLDLSGQQVFPSYSDHSESVLKVRKECVDPISIVSDFAERYQVEKGRNHTNCSQ